MSTARRHLSWMGSFTLALAGCSNGGDSGGVGGSSAGTTVTSTGAGTTTQPPPCAPRPFEPLATDARLVSLAPGLDSVTALISASDSLQVLKIGVSAEVLWPKSPDHAAFHGDVFQRIDGTVCAAFLEQLTDGSVTPVQIACEGNPPVSTQLTPVPSPTLGRVPIVGAGSFTASTAYVFTQSDEAMTVYSGGPAGWEDLGALAPADSYPIDAVSMGGIPVACYLPPDRHVSLNLSVYDPADARDAGPAADDCRIATDQNGAIYVTADDRFARTDSLAPFTTQPVDALGGTPVDALAAWDGRAYALASSAEGRKLVELTADEVIPLEIPPGPRGQSGMVVDASGALVIAVTDDSNVVHIGAICP